jgi:hypothetical protein
MRPIALVCGLMLASSAALAQGSLMDLGKGVLKNQLESQMGGGSSASSGGSLGSGLGVGEIASGLKDALKVASERVTRQLGAKDGFNADPSIHIPLPENLKLAQQGLKMAGQSALLDDLELKLNRAAETATPRAKQLFFDAVSRMTLDDARGILNGPQDAATQYFKKAMSPDLKTAMRPVVDKTVADAGAVKAYQGVAASAASLPMVGQAVQAGPGMLTDHVLDYALSGIFSYLGKEEAAIRSNPAQRSTELIKKVFGG